MRGTRSTIRRLAAGLLLSSAAVVGAAETGPPHLVLISVDTLRADRLSGYGYRLPTSPNIDRLLAGGARFGRARTVEPLTAPGLTSMVTGLYPHEHGATRNGISMRQGLPSLSKVLSRRGYRTGAFVGNWTLNDKLSGLAEHFDDYEAVLTKSRWLFWARESTADDLNEAALSWFEAQRKTDPRQRLALWVHYVEPHAPYVNHGEYAERLGFAGRSSTKKSRYDTEIAFVDERIADLLDEVDRLLGGEPRLTIFTADHGESLGEHGYWGHGRNTYEPGLRIPLGFSWPGVIDPVVVDSPALIIDIPPTVLGLLGLPQVPSFQGFDWAAVLRGEAEAPADRATMYQAHRGATQASDRERVRQRGLLEVARIERGVKEILRIGNGNRWQFDLTEDPAETASQAPLRSPVSPALAAWLEVVQSGLAASDELPLPELSQEDIERLRALGYLD